MKSLTTFLFLFLGLVFNAVSQDQKQVPLAPADDPNAPEITFEKDFHDFGTIDYGSDGNCEFKYTNTGIDPLLITQCNGSCGCTAPQCPKESVLRGQSAIVKVHYDTKRPGPFTKTVSVMSNAKNGVKVLTIKGIVRSQEQTDDQMPLKKDNGMSPLENQMK